MIETSQPTYIALDPVIGWESAIESLSPFGGDSLALDCVPGQPARFAEMLADKIEYPVALALDRARQSLYLLELRAGRINAINLQLQNLKLKNSCGDPQQSQAGDQPQPCHELEFSTVPGIGGKGKGPRQLLNPRGLATMVDGSLVVADTGNHQVKIFSSFPHALLTVWGSGKPGDGPLQFKSPWKALADSCGLIYVADRGNGRIQRIQRDGTSREPITGLVGPSGLALGVDGTLAVLDSNSVRIFVAGKTHSAQRFDVPDGSCLTFDDDGQLYVGTSTALIYKFVPTGKQQFREAGIGVTGRDANFLDLLWTRGGQLLGILLERSVPKPQLWSVCTCGSYSPAGTLTTGTLDSGIEGCAWHRIEFEASVPEGTSVEVATQTSKTDWGKDAVFQAQSFSYSSANSATSIYLTGENPDCLVQSGPGQYLRLQVTLHSNGVSSPRLRRIRIHFPRESYLQYLPAVYQEDDESRLFLERFLSIFQTTFDGLDQCIDDLWMQFDPASTSAKWLPWLASWIALPVNPRWFNQQQQGGLQEARAALKAAGKEYPRRGTPSGIQEFIKQYSGVDARLVEHFRLRQLVILSEPAAGAQPTAQYVPRLGASPLCAGGRLWSRDYYQRLQVGVYSRIGYFRLTGEPEPGIEPLAWGANEFSVFFDCDPYQIKETQKEVADVVEREKPAYTKANYCPVLPRMRVGVQATLGIDSRLGIFTPLLLGTTGRLGYDSILGCDPARPHLSGSLRYPAQIDVNTRLQ
jgi:phage tail-like protein